MRKTHFPAAVLLLAITISGRLGFAQDSPSLLVVPSNVTMLVGETHKRMSVTADIAFGEPEVFQGRPIIETLTQLANMVQATV